MADLLASDEPRRLADFLRENRDQILAHWETEVRKVRAARQLERPLLIDHVPEFIEDLAEYVDELRTGHDVAPPGDQPRIHALERLEVGYDLAEVVAEYAVLRRCITELASRMHTPALRSAELPRLHDAIDQAIAASVVGYTEARERTLRALDRISTAALVHHDVESLLPRILDAFLGTTASVDTVALVLREDGVLRVRAAFGYPEPGPVGMEAPAEGFCARVEREATPVLVRDASADPLVACQPVCPPGTLALYGVPLTMGGKVLGVAVMGSRSSWEFSQEDQFLFRTMVNRVAALIAQARLDAEVARRAAELEAVLDSLPEALYVGDAKGIKRANRAALELLGYRSVSELDGDIARLAEEMQTRYPDGRPMPLDEQVYMKALRGERAAQDVIVRHRTTGNDVVVRSSAAPIRLGDRIVGAVALNTDISARTAEEAELRAAVEFRDRILGVLSHDVRNPLGVILTSAGMLERQLANAGAGNQLAAMRRIIDNAHQIERMVHDLLDYTRTRQGRRLPIAARDADLLALCLQSADGLQVLHPDRILELSALGDTRLRLDPDRAAQVIANLVGNAILYSPKGSPVRILVDGSGDPVLLEVRNEGQPIPPETMPHLFEAFQRGDAGRVGNADGLGLGLFIAQQIVAAHGGSISVRSTAAEGTTFTVRWPRKGS
jgi:signal transduction histidine kinase